MNRERRIIVIQPNRKASKSTASRTKLRVAAYCRVSTEEEEQQGSFEIQKEFYTAKINSTPEWKLAGIYADDGISGVHTKKRDGFNQMIQDCKKHKIDLILTKSISRFARNTVDSIQYVRILKQFGVTVIFEKENINTSTIENNHEGIVTKQMYREVQAEIARRNSKSCANRRKQKRGRYNSKYALSERLYCGECGSPYKRVTWNIHGRKEIVWRCVNRVTYGTKFCHNSPSVQEEALHQTLLRAIQNLADNYTEEVAMQINGILHDLQGGTTELEKLQQKLADSQQEFDRLLDLSLECDASFLDEKLKHASEEIDTMQKQIDQLTASQQKAANPNLQLTDSDFRITEYSDILVARIIERIDVVSANEIKIEFIGGYTVTAPLQS